MTEAPRQRGSGDNASTVRDDRSVPPRSNLHIEALAYARAGLAVFPLAPGRKEPLIPGGRGFRNASTDPAQIDKWWFAHPNANIGVAVPEGTVVLDIDPRHGGDHAFLELQRQYGPFPPTRKMKSGGGGWHYWYRVNGGTVRNPGTGIDLKSGGKGYAVAPPSVHPETGKPYEWEGDGSEPIADLPDWLYAPATGGDPPRHEIYADPELAADPKAPGHDFNRRGDLLPFLIEAGWVEHHRDGADIYLTRPGKDPREGHSAVWHSEGEGRQFVTFSLTEEDTGLPIPSGDQHASFSPWRAFAYLRHRDANGTVHFKAAAAELRKLGFGQQPDSEILPPPTHPMPVARILLKDYREDEGLTLHHWRGSWMHWQGPHWVEVEDRTVRSEVYHRVENARYKHETKDGIEEKPWAPNRHKMGDLLEALAAQTHLPQEHQPPIWLDGVGKTTGVVACRNGLLDVTTRTLYPHSPQYFNEISVPFDYDSGAHAPKLWLNFLKELWDDDPVSTELLAEWFGYGLSGRTNLQKILAIIGPRRSGKGTICRVLRGLSGERNVCAPTLSSFGQNFGLQPLIGKSLAIIGDVRLGGGEQPAVVERLLSISGEDALTIDRKYRDPWTGQLPTRIMMVSNELPRFGDASGAIATRFLVLQTHKSWLGNEDHDLTMKLLPELPGILNWSLDGLANLNRRGRFSEPESSAEITAALADLVSPVGAFVRECCEVNPQAIVMVKTLYQAWKVWAEDNGHRPGSAQTFGGKLRSVIPTVKVFRPRGDDDKQERAYEGVRLTWRP